MRRRHRIDLPGLDCVKADSERTRRTISICAGAFPLAATGSLDGRRAATHWKLARQLAARFPRVTVDAAALFVTEGKFVTSAGVTAGIDLVLSPIEHDCGPALARDVARDLVVFMARPGDQSQFSVRREALPTNHSVVRSVMDVITASSGRHHTLSSLVAETGVSSRHLPRLFLAETSYTPKHFIDRTRLEAACAMLSGGSATQDQIAERTGLGSSESLRRLFHRELGITPSAYRNKFRTATN